MASLRRKLPPPNSLVAFEAAARHLNFTRAAEELNVTQAAVSRQIQVLEEHLGTLMFHRRHRAMELTGQGEKFFRAVAMGLEHIANTASDLRSVRGAPAAVTVATSVAFASYWLMARIASFRAANPDIDLRLVAAAPVRDLAVAGIDIAIRYGPGKWSGAVAEHLFDNEVWPVCSPSYLKARPPIRSVADLTGETLLHLSRFDRNWVTWPAWLEDQGIARAPDKPGLEFDNYMVLIQAALGGQGIALCGGRLAEDFLARGDLVRPVEATMSSAHAFYLLHPADTELSRDAALFRDWILEEAKGRPADAA